MKFGIMISCYRGDLPLLKGCLASLRLFMPDTPVCLVKHGQFPTRGLEEQYSVFSLEEEEVDPRLQKMSYGYGLTKMVSFWHSPFDRFLHIDPDAVCWGNLIEDLPYENYDLIFNEPHEKITHHIQKTQYFDPDLAKPLLKGWKWINQPYFNTGIFSAKRGTFDIDEYLEILSFQKAQPGSLFTDQGPLGILTFRNACRGSIKVRDWPLQAVVPVIPVQELKSRFRFVDGDPAVAVGDRRLIHWAGKKPLLIRKHPFHQPMTHFRLRHLANQRSFSRFFGSANLYVEELHYRLTSRHSGSYFKAAASKFRYLIYRLSRHFRRLKNVRSNSYEWAISS